MTPAIVADALVSGLLTGGLYALAGVGLALIQSVLRLFDAAHGGLFAASTALAWLLATRLGIDPYASLPLVAIILFGSGWALYAELIAKIARHSPERALLAVFALAGMLEGAAHLLLGTDPHSAPMPYAVSIVAAGPLILGLPLVASFLVAAAILAMLAVFMTQTDTGRSLQAVAWEPVAARLVGIRPERMRPLAFGVGAACLGAAGCLRLATTGTAAADGPQLLLIACTTVLLGGPGNMPGAVAGGLLVGLAESAGSLLLPGDGQAGAAIGLLFLTAALLRPLAPPSRTTRA